MGAQDDALRNKLEEEDEGIFLGIALP